MSTSQLTAETAKSRGRNHVCRGSVLTPKAYEALAEREQRIAENFSEVDYGLFKAGLIDWYGRIIATVTDLGREELHHVI